MPSKRTLGGVVVLIIFLADVFALSVIVKRGWHLPTGFPDHHRDLEIGLKWLAWIILGCCFVILPVIDSLHDVKWVRRWTPPARAADKDFISWLTQVRTTRGTISLLSAMERRLPVKEAQGVAGAISDFYRTLAMVSTLDRKTRPVITDATLRAIGPLQTPGIGERLKTYDRKHPRRLRDVRAAAGEATGRVRERNATASGGCREAPAVHCTKGLGIVALCPFLSWWTEPEGCQDPGGVPGVVAAGRGDAGVPGQFQDPDAEVSQGGYDLWSAAVRIWEASSP